MRKMKVGIQLYGLRQHMEQDFAATLRAVRDMGYDTVEFAGYFGHSAEQIRDLLHELGLQCISVHQSLDFFDENPEEKIAFLKGFGVKYNVIPWYPKDCLAGTPAWKDTVEKLNRAADLFHTHDMMLGYHNHDFEFQKADGKYLHDWIFDSVPADRIVPEIDTCWVRYAGLSPEQTIRRFRGRVQLVHLKDFTCKKFAGGPAYALIDKNGNEKEEATREDHDFRFTPLGMGVQDFAPILEACDACGTEYVIVEQDQAYEMGELKAAEISRRYLKEQFGL